MGCLLWEIHFACVSLSIKKEAVKHQTYPPRQILYKLVDEESPVSKICFCNIIVLRPHAMLSKGSVDAAHHAVRLFNTFPKQFYISWKMHQAFITVGICIDCLKILYVWVPAINAEDQCNTAVAKSLLTTFYHSICYLCINQIRNN